MNSIERMLIQHILAYPKIAVIVTAAIANIDRIIKVALKVVSPAQLDAAIDAADAAAKAEVDKEAKAK